MDSESYVVDFSHEYIWMILIHIFSIAIAIFFMICTIVIIIQLLKVLKKKNKLLDYELNKIKNDESNLK